MTHVTVLLASLAMTVKVVQHNVCCGFYVISKSSRSSTVKGCENTEFALDTVLLQCQVHSLLLLLWRLLLATRALLMDGT